MQDNKEFLFDVRRELDRHRAGGYQFNKKLTLTIANPSATILDTEDINALGYVIEGIMLIVTGATAWDGEMTKLSFGDGVIEIASIAKESLSANANYMLADTEFNKTADFYKATPLKKLVIATDATATAGSDIEIYVHGRIIP